jgi:S-adenosylmethionine hydrolase
MREFVVPVTDCTDVALNELRATIYRHHHSTSQLIVEPNVAVTPYCLTNASFQIRLLADSYPERTIFFCMANFGPNRPRRIVGRTIKHQFVFQGADTGAFTWLLDDFGCDEVYELNDPGFRPFGGKYVHAPVLGAIASGQPLASVGQPIPPESLVRHDIGAGEIVHIDNFGNAKINMPSGELAGHAEARVTGPGFSLDCRVAARMMDLPTGTWVVYPGSSMGLVEVAQVRGRGFLDLPATAGDHLGVTFA